jgi:hypothetical protein
MSGVSFSMGRRFLVMRHEGVGFGYLVVMLLLFLSGSIYVASVLPFASE